MPSLVLLSLVLHPVMAGIAFSTTAVILAQIFVVMPFLIVSLEGTTRT